MKQLGGAQNLVLGLAASLALHGQTSVAQEPGVGKIDQIIVTAERRPVEQQAVMGSIAVFDRRELEIVNADHPSELLNRSAGVNIHRGSGQEHLTAVRSPVLTGGAGAGSFLYLEDGIPLRAAGFANVNGLFEASTETAGGVEVVKGPGSVLYGSNAVHGLVNIISAAPSDSKSAGLDISTGSHWLTKGSGFVSGPIGKSTRAARLRLDVHAAHDAGYRSDSGYDQQKAKLQIVKDVGTWSVGGAVSYQNLNQETAGFVQGPEAFRDRGLSRQNAFPQAFRDVKSVRGHLRLERQVGTNGSIALTPYARWTDMDFLLHFLPSQALEQNSHASGGLLTTYYWDTDNLSVIAGLDIEGTKGSLSEVQTRPTIFSFVQGVHYDYDVTSYVVSPYAQVRWRFAPKWVLESGIRVDYTRYDYTNNTDDGTFGRFIRIPDRTDEFVTPTPKLGLSYEANNNLTLYSRYARGTRAPQTTDLYRVQQNQMGAEAEPEELDALEAGLRGTRGSANLSLAAFTMWKRNFFFRDADGFNVVDGKTRHTGVEATLFSQLKPYLALSGDVTYARHTYNFDNTVANGAESIRDGDDVDSAPRWLANARLIITPSEQVSAELEWRHVGDYFTDASNTNDYEGHNVLVVRAAYSPTDNVTVYARVNNVANTDYAERADFAFGNERFFPGEGRTAFGGIRVRF